MKANAKRRVLVSSLSMLLVAAVSLGAATYAWFTSNTQATADQLSVKTVKSSELQISKTTGEWGDQIHYDYVGKVLKPATSADGTNWFTAVAAGKGSFAADNAQITDISASLDGYVFKEQLNVRNNGKAAVNNVKIKFSLSETETNNGKYVRLALVPADTRGAAATITADNFRENVYSSAEDTAEALADTTGTNVVTVNAKSGSAAEISVGSLTAAGEDGSAKYYNLYVWFEGQDEDCKDANAGNEMPDVTFTVTGDTAEQV